MKRATQFFQWVLKPWPLIVILCLAGLNIWLYHLLHYDKSTVHKYISVALQVLGGFFVLYSLNENMGVFKQASLPQRIRDYFRAFPLKKRPIPIHKYGSAQISGRGDMSATGERGVKTIEERVERLEKRLDACFQEVGKARKELNERIEAVKTELKTDLLEKGKKIRDLESLLETAAIGNMDSQVFGILLVFYGTILPLF